MLLQLRIQLTTSPRLQRQRGLRPPALLCLAALALARRNSRLLAWRGAITAEDAHTAGMGTAKANGATSCARRRVWKRARASASKCGRLQRFSRALPCTRAPSHTATQGGAFDTTACARVRIHCCLERTVSVLIRTIRVGTIRAEQLTAAGTTPAGSRNQCSVASLVCRIDVSLRVAAMGWCVEPIHRVCVDGFQFAGAHARARGMLALLIVAQRFLGGAAVVAFSLRV